MAICMSVPIRLAGPDDLEEIGRLLPQVADPQFPERYPKRAIAEFCRWKYFTNPYGDAAVGIAVDGGHVPELDFIEARKIDKRRMGGRQGTLLIHAGERSCVSELAL
jgi:hypothetical protein